MLVLQQDANSKTDAVVEIWLPDGRTVEVELVDVRNGQRARIGYTAPPDVKIHRRSVAKRIRAGEPMPTCSLVPIIGSTGRP